MNGRDARIWAKFVELLSLELHDGDEQLAKERPAVNLYGSITAHKKVFKQACDIIYQEDVGP